MSPRAQPAPDADGNDRYPRNTLGASLVAQQNMACPVYRVRDWPFPAEPPYPADDENEETPHG